MTVKVLEVLGRSAGGIARHVAQIAGALDDGADRVIEVAAPPGLPVALPGRVHEVDIPDGPLIGHRAAVARLRSLIREGGFDIVHAHGLRAGIDSGIAAGGRVPVFLTVHNLVRPEVSGALKARLYKRAEILAVRLAGHTFAVSEDIAEHLKRVVPTRSSDIETLYLGVGPAPKVGREREDVLRELDLPPEARLVVTVARLARQKALPEMLDAVARLPGTVFLAILGEGPLEAALRAHARRLDLGERVLWLGFRSDVADYVAAADVFCLSSVWEGVPLAAQEAILLGTPVVATAVGGMPELIEDKATGRLVPPGDASRLAGALADVLGSPDRGRALARRARDHLETRFSTPAMLGRLVEAYDGALAA